MTTRITSICAWIWLHTDWWPINHETDGAKPTKHGAIYLQWHYAVHPGCVVKTKEEEQMNLHTVAHLWFMNHPMHIHPSIWLIIHLIWRWIFLRQYQCTSSRTLGIDMHDLLGVPSTYIHEDSWNSTHSPQCISTHFKIIFFHNNILFYTVHNSMLQPCWQCRQVSHYKYSSEFH